MSVFDQGSLQASPLADLHAIASELSIDGYRRLRREELIEAILRRQSGGEEPAAAEEAVSDEAPVQAASGEAASAEEAPAEDGPAEDGPAETPARRRSRRGGRGRGGKTEAETATAEATEEALEAPEAEQADKEAESERPDQEVIEGVVELLPGGSGFVRVHPPDPSDEDVYVSSAQVRRCELVSGDRVSGPRRAPRRSERFASLVRVDTVNGRPATELADGVRFDDLPLAFPDQSLELPGLEPRLLEMLERVGPIGRGSRVTIVGPACAGKTELLRRLAREVAQVAGLKSWLVLTGVRPEEIPEWRAGTIEPSVALSFGSSGDAQGQALEGVVEQVRRLVARGADAVVLIDTLDGVAPPMAQKALSSARNIVDGGSLTVIATASAPIGGETTLIVLDRTSADEIPAIDAAQSWTIRRERLE
jgi:transcription termination factor Rho